MKKIITAAAVLSMLSLGGCETIPDFSQMTPAQIQAYQAYRAQQSASMDALLDQTNKWSQGMQANSQQMLQSTSQGMAATQQANREWTQRDSSGAIVHCIQVGIYTTCK